MDLTASRFLVALASLVLNLGARHLPNGLSPQMQVLTTSDGMRTLVLCALFYLSTRDVMLSVALAFVFFAVTSTLLNERSRYSLLAQLHLEHTNNNTHAPPFPSGPHAPLMLISRQGYDMAVETVLAFRRQARQASLTRTKTGSVPGAAAPPSATATGRP